MAILLVIFFQSKEFQAKSILHRTYKKYASLSSYSSTGSTVDEVGDGRKLTATFSMRLGRPNYYLVEYEQHADTFTNKGAVWADGTGDYFANDVAGTSFKQPYPNSTENLDMIQGLSGGTSAIVPTIFFPGVKMGERIATWIARLLGKQHEPLREWSDPDRWAKVSLATEQDGKVGNVDCYVLSAEFRNGHALLWVGKEDFLVHQSREWVKMTDSETTDQMIARLLKDGMQSPVSMDEMKRRIEEGRKKAETTMKTVTVAFADKGFVPKPGSSHLISTTIDPPSYRVYTQTYRDIVVGQTLTSSNFVHTNAISHPSK